MLQWALGLRAFGLKSKAPIASPAPIKSVLMVTHNIEEAVLMCDRILVFSSNPGRVIAEIKVTLPFPRNRFDPAAARRQAVRFNSDRFINEFVRYVEGVLDSPGGPKKEAA